MIAVFVVTYNIPGYLPESEPIAFPTLHQAREYVGDLVTRWWDEEYETAFTADARLAIDGRYLPAHTEAPLMGENDAVHIAGPSDTHLGWNIHINTD